MKTGGALLENVIDELEELGSDFERLGPPTNKRKYKQRYEVIRFKDYPDDVPIKILGWFLHTNACVSRF